MLPLKGLLLSSCLIALAASAAVKAPTGSLWANISPKSVYSRSLGPPVSDMGTITVPYMPKSPFVPKFVDPKMMISKKTDMLTNLFGGLGPAYPPDFKPVIPYGMSGSTLYSVGGETPLLGDSGKDKIGEGSGGFKRGMFGPFSPKIGPMGPKFGAMSQFSGPDTEPFLDDYSKANIGAGSGGFKRGMFGPFSPKFGPMAPKFGGMSPFAGPDTIPDYSAAGFSSRKRRSVDKSSAQSLRAIMDDSKPETKDLGPPPSYPTLAPISEETEGSKPFLQAVDGATVPKEYMPGMFGPFAPMVDPSMFITKKSAFLDMLFKNIATSTAAPTSTEVPVPKSTIVPPSFWFPTAMIPSPTEYDDKVSAFLENLFDQLKLNKTGISAPDSVPVKNDILESVKPDTPEVEAKVARSVEDLSSINAAKDTIVDAILSELSTLKGGMVTTMNDMIAYEKSSAATTPPKKPFKPFAPGMWMKPSADPMIPFQQRMAVLSQVFDTLTDIQKNISLAIQNSIKSSANSPDTSDNSSPSSDNYFPSMPNDAVYGNGNLPINISLLEAIKNKLTTIDGATPTYVPSSDKFGFKTVRMVPQSPGSFWMSYPEDMTSTVKRQVDSDSADYVDDENNDSEHNNQRQHTRAVKMQMHQGYQSLPAGSIESIQAGGGSVPGHQGGGIKLLDTDGYGNIDKWNDWAEYNMRKEQQGHRHHNHH